MFNLIISNYYLFITENVWRTGKRWTERKCSRLEVLKVMNRKLSLIGRDYHLVFITRKFLVCFRMRDRNR